MNLHALESEPSPSLSPAVIDRLATSSQALAPAGLELHSRETVAEILQRMETHAPRSVKGSLHALVNAMVRHHRPMKIASLAKLPEMSHISLSTIYRLVGQLDEAALLRRLGRDSKALHYMLLIPGCYRNYLTCMGCGQIQAFEEPEDMARRQAELEAKSRWKAVRCEVELFGWCPECG